MNSLEFLVTIAWNVYIGNKAPGLVKALKAMIKEHSPDVIALMEASNLYGELDSLGYRVVQLKPKPLKKGNQPGQGNIAILVSKEYVIQERKALRMTAFWRGPKHGWPQDPRVYRYVKIRKRNDPKARTWVIAAAHTPFGPVARAESRQALVAWLKGETKDPTILLLDANMSLADFRHVIAKPGKANASGVGIDLEAHKNCQLVKETNLGRGLSDHPAIKRRYSAKRSDA